MPMPGDQHRDNAATTNPFADNKVHVTEYTAQEIATLQSRLNQQLGPEYISTRPGAGGGKVHYLAAEKVINLANEVFGFNGWSSAIQNVQIDFVDEHASTGKITLGLSTIVRVTLRDGTYHEDIGYGHIENCKGKAAAFEKAKKEAATDAMKRALRNFGNVLGNCLYDKDYLQKVTKVKIAPTRWDAENLHRHPDYAPIKRESIMDVEQKHEKEKASASNRQTSVQSGVSFGSVEFEEEFGADPFDDTEISHPDEVRIDETTRTPLKAVQHAQTVPRTHSMPQMRPPNLQQPPPLQTPQAPQRPQGPPRPPNNPAQAQPMRQPMPHETHHQQPADPHVCQRYPEASTSRSNPDSPSIHVQQNQQSNLLPQHRTVGGHLDKPEIILPREPPAGVPEGFVTGRSVALLDQPPGSRPPNSAIAFNPHAETPSIRRTHGVNPGKSAPVMRSALGGGAAAAPMQGTGQSNGMNGVAAPVRTNFVNPSADMNRRVGMPPSAAVHAMQNRSAYRPPTPAKRPPLSDVSNLQQLDGAGDAKKAKVDDVPEVPTGNDQDAIAAAAMSQTAA